MELSEIYEGYMITLSQVTREDKIRVFVRKYWKEACRYDIIREDAMFVNFSENNPYVPKLNRAMGFLQRALKPKPSLY